MIRMFKYPLRPTSAQRATFNRWLGQCCEIYNAGLEQRVTWYRKAGVSLTMYAQFGQLADLRAEDPWFRSLPSDIARSALRRLDNAFSRFFRRTKSGSGKSGFPRYRSASRYRSLAFSDTRVRVDVTDPRNGWVRVPSIGYVRFRIRREMAGSIKDVRLVRDDRGRWFVCFACDVGDAPPMRAVETTTGIDLGLTTFAVLSDGSDIANPRHTKRAAESLARAQRVLARKTNGSNSRRKAKRAVARVHERIVNARRDFHCKTARALVDKYDLIAHEKLNIAGLARSGLPGMAKSIHDVGWGQFISILHSKAEEAGVTVIAVDPRNTTRECSQCGAIVPKELGERTHRCNCGLTLGRDHNAALNILARGLRAVPGLTAGPEVQS